MAKSQMPRHDLQLRLVVCEPDIIIVINSALTEQKVPSIYIIQDGYRVYFADS